MVGGMAEEKLAGVPSELAAEEHAHLRALFENGARPAEAVAFLVARGHSDADARRLADGIDDEVRERRYGSPRALAPEPELAGAKPHGGLLNVIGGVLLVAAGASGEFVLKGTQSPIALVVLGVIVIGVGAWRMYSARWA
jgi:hypothetical protein